MNIKQLTIFLTITCGPFWSIRTARILWVAVLGTQIIATLIAVYGFLMTPQIARRAYELYEQRGRHEGHADKEWHDAEQEILKD